MKKIMLLIFATLTLVSCGVNSLNPEKLELGKLPESGDPLNTVQPVDTKKLAVTKPTKIGTITTAIQNDVYTISGYTTTPTASHVVYYSSANKGSEIFSLPTINGGGVAIDVDGKVDGIPAVAAPLNGGGYKIWVLKVYQP